MEAHSLASLNRLAANPPAYPTNPSEDVQEPLTLYISRVPGTRDIILSPSKPQLKNVTGEDVAGCLYYVHLEAPSSDFSDPLFPSHDAPRPSGDDSASIRTIHRKPLPSTALPLVPERPPPATPPQVQRRPVSLASTREDHLPPLPPRDRERCSSVGSYGGNPQSVSGALPDFGRGSLEGHFDALHLSPSQPKGSPRKPPLGTSAFAISPFETQDNFWSAPSQHMPLDPSPALSVYEHWMRPDEPRASRDMPSTEHRSCPPSPKKKDLTVCTPFTLSLIRRDPGTSSQWNVGKISSYQIESTQTPSQEADHLSVYSSIFPEPMPMQHPPISIHIETSGYARFRNNPVRENIDLGHASAAQIRASFDSGAFSRRADANTYFARQISMAYSKSWSSNLKEKFHQASRKMSHARSESQASTCSEHTVESATASPEAPSLDRLKARGYTFQSPWDKRCEFRTGHGGRSVQCRHVLHDSQTVTYNPLVAEAPKPSAVVVSELRFNLPAADFFPPSEAQRDSMQNYGLVGHFGKFLKAAAGTGTGTGTAGEDGEADQGLVSPFDLNIGSEKAGGGPHGTRAKLGKLIIYHDGLKMLDLIVAANMGLWWGAWEKSF